MTWCGNALTANKKIAMFKYITICYNETKYVI